MATINTPLAKTRFSRVARVAAWLTTVVALTVTTLLAGVGLAALLSRGAMMPTGAGGAMSAKRSEY